jgi:hypothetical protein
MSNIRTKEKTLEDSRKDKDCQDFLPLDDGTLTGDWRYCQLSFICQQMHPNDAGILIGCIGHHLMVKDPSDPTGEEIFASFCTGCLRRDERDDEDGKFQKTRILRAGDD